MTLRKPPPSKMGLTKTTYALHYWRTCTYYGEQWYTNGHVAIPEIPRYRNADQWVVTSPPVKPDLGAVVKNVKFSTPVEAFAREDNQCPFEADKTVPLVHLRDSAQTLEIALQAHYFDYLTWAYKGCSFRASDERRPVQVTQKGAVVAYVMPFWLKNRTDGSHRGKPPVTSRLDRTH